MPRKNHYIKKFITFENNMLFLHELILVSRLSTACENVTKRIDVLFFRFNLNVVFKELFAVESVNIAINKNNI